MSYIWQNSYVYNRNPQMSDAEIYQHQVALEELKAQIVNLYKDENDEIITLCPPCANSYPYGELTYIDKAANWDECCYCTAQNVPRDYHGEI